MSITIQSFWKLRNRSLMAVYLGLLPNLIVLATGWTFFSKPPGSEVPSMGWAALVATLTLAPIAVVPYSIFAIVKEKSWLPVIGILLSFCPAPLSHLWLQYATDTVGFTLGP